MDLMLGITGDLLFLMFYVFFRSLSILCERVCICLFVFLVGFLGVGGGG